MCSPPRRLTARELDVLGLLGAGLSNIEIGEKLFLSVATVRAHTISIVGKIGVNGRVAAADYAIRHGLVTEGERE